MLMLEFYEGEDKVAECPAIEVFELPRKNFNEFWSVQDDRERSIKLRIAEEGEK
jgi:hypothetical protein